MLRGVEASSRGDYLPALVGLGFVFQKGSGIHEPDIVMPDSADFAYSRHGGSVRMRTHSIVAKLLLIVSAPFLAVEAAAQAQNVDGGENEVICTSILLSWQGSIEDTRQIDTVPVPKSFRESLESADPCRSLQLDRRGLIDWHLRFGTASSVEAALTYLEERDSVRPSLTPQRYVPELQSAFQAATPDLKRASELVEPQGTAYSVRQRYLYKSRSVGAFRQLLNHRERFIFFGEQHLRAAEEFGSPGLLAKADTYLQPVFEATRYLAPLEDKAPVAGMLYFNLHGFRTDDLRARSAILGARLSGAKTAIDSARAILTSQLGPDYVRIAETAFSGGDDFCDISSGWSRSEEIKAACRADDDNETRISDYWINRAIFDAIFDPGGAAIGQATVTGSVPSSAYLASRLLRFESLSENGGRCCGRRADEDLLRVLVADAEGKIRLVRRGLAGENVQDVEQSWREALDRLQEAEQLARPYQAAGRFRRIGEKWLEVWLMGASLFADSDGNRDPRRNPDLQRYADYLRSNLGPSTRRD